MTGLYRIGLTYRYLNIYYSDNAIKKRFFNNLVHMCNVHNVDLLWFDTTMDLNKHYWGESVDRLAVGVHAMNKITKKAEIGISLEGMERKEDSVWILAHELGHNYGIRIEENRSEERADEYINILAQLCLDEIDYNLLKPLINIYSDVDVDVDSHKHETFRKNRENQLHILWEYTEEKIKNKRKLKLISLFKKILNKFLLW